jgi:hypothetical protein
MVLSLGLWLHSPVQDNFPLPTRSPALLSVSPILLTENSSSPADLTQLTQELESNVEKCREGMSKYLEQVRPIANGSESTTTMRTQDLGAPIGDLSEVRDTINQIRKALPNDRSEVLKDLSQMESTIIKTEERLQENATLIDRNEYSPSAHNQLDEEIRGKRFQLGEELDQITDQLSKLTSNPEPQPPTSFPFPDISPLLGILVLTAGGILWQTQRARAEALMPLPQTARTPPGQGSAPTSQSYSAPPPHQTPTTPNHKTNSSTYAQPNSTQPRSPQSPPRHLSLPPATGVEPLIAANGYPMPDWIDRYNDPDKPSELKIHATEVGETFESFTQRNGYVPATNSEQIIFQQSPNGNYWLFRSRAIQGNEPFDYLVLRRDINLNLHDRQAIHAYFELPDGASGTDAENNDYQVVYPAIVFPLAKPQGVEEPDRWRLVQLGRLELRQPKEPNPTQFEPPA